MWELFSQPGVSIGFSWYSADPAKHAEVTGSRASHARTTANIREAVRRGIRLRASIVEVVQDQGIEAAMGHLRALGVTNMHADRSRGAGRAAHGADPAVSQLCGRCGRSRAAIGMDGQLTPCVLGRFLVAGNVKETPLGEILNPERWRAILAVVPPRDACGAVLGLAEHPLDARGVREPTHLVRHLAPRSPWEISGESPEQARQRSAFATVYSREVSRQRGLARRPESPPEDIDRRSSSG